MINPEFQRNLWLQFSLHRFIAMPAILGLLFLAIGFANNTVQAHIPIDTAAMLLFIGIVCIWGTRNANNAMIEEVRDKTWDQQRMSALGPWSMTWGKLFGATAFNWYGGLFCLLAFVLATLLQQPPYLFALSSGLTLIALGILMHASTITLNLHMMRSDLRIIQRGGIAWIIVIFALIFRAPIRSSQHLSIVWWNQNFSFDLFLLASTIFFAIIAVFAAWRSMQNALQVATVPWAWPLGCGIWAVYIAGFMGADKLLWIGLLLAIAMTYATLFWEENGITLWQRVLVRAKSGHWYQLLQNLALWPTTLLLSFLFALLLAINNNQALPSDIATTNGSLLGLVLALMLLRDCCVYLFFAFSSKSNQAGATTLLYLTLINGVLPFLFKMMGFKALFGFFMPLFTGNGWTALAIALVQSLLAVLLLHWRWRQQINRSQPQPIPQT